MYKEVKSARQEVVKTKIQNICNFPNEEGGERTCVRKCISDIMYCKYKEHLRGGIQEGIRTGNKQTI